MDELSKKVAVVPVGSSASASMSLSTPPKAQDSDRTTKEKNAHFLGLEASYYFTHNSATVYVEFASCMSSGILVYVYTSESKEELLGHVKTPQKLQDSPSLHGVCKMHKPSCSCWVTCNSQATKQDVMRKLLEWLVDGQGVGKLQHQAASVDLRVSYGMKVRKRT